MNYFSCGTRHSGVIELFKGLVLPCQMPFLFGLLVSEVHVFAPNMVAEIARLAEILVAYGAAELFDLQVGDFNVPPKGNFPSESSGALRAHKVLFTMHVLMMLLQLVSVEELSARTLCALMMELFPVDPPDMPVQVGLAGVDNPALLTYARQLPLTGIPVGVHVDLHLFGAGGGKGAPLDLTPNFVHVQVDCVRVNLEPELGHILFVAHRANPVLFFGVVFHLKIEALFLNRGKEH